MQSLPTVNASIYQRPGVLCGSCREGLSMILGSSECKTCSNIYLVSISIFILMGVAIVTVVTLLNLRVSVGTLNRLILFACKPTKLHFCHQLHLIPVP